MRATWRSRRSGVALLGAAQCHSSRFAAPRPRIRRSLYRSITDKLLTLPDDLVLFAAHYSGSICGRGLSPTPVSTLGYERRNNMALQFGSEEEFASALTADIPAAPPEHAAIVAANRSGRSLALT